MNRTTKIKIIVAVILLVLLTGGLVWRYAGHSLTSSKPTNTSTTVQPGTEDSDQSAAPEETDTGGSVPDPIPPPVLTSPRPDTSTTATPIK